MGKQQPLRPIKFGERRSPAECKQLEGVGAAVSSAVTVRTSVKAGHAAWPRQVMPADLTPNSSHNSNTKS